MSGMKRLAIGLAALVLIPCVAVLWFVWSASTLGPDEAGLAAVSAGISEAFVEVFLSETVDARAGARTRRLLVTRGPFDGCWSLSLELVGAHSLQRTRGDHHC